MSKLFFLLIAGGIGGALGWLINEPFISKEVILNARQEDLIREIVRFGLIIGGCVSGMIGFASGMLRGTTYLAMRGLLIGLIVGAIGGCLGFSIASGIYGALGGHSDATNNFIVQIFARSVAWSALGGFLGLSEGATSRSIRRGVQGMLGGFIGGFIGGVLFDIIGTLTATAQFAASPDSFRNGTGEVGIFSRAIGFTITGASIGFFVGLIEMVSKQAWVRVIMGRNEGKEFSLDAVNNTLGRAENADVPLRGDMNVAPHHARIIKTGSQHAILDLGTSPQGTRVNGQPVQQAPLRDGDQISIGSFQIVFHEKEGSAQKASRDRMRVPTMAPPMNLPPGTCAFCGQVKDASGQCACTVAGASLSTMPMPAAPTMGMPGTPGGYAPTMGGTPPGGMMGQPTQAMFPPGAAPLQPTALVGMDGPVVNARFAITGMGLTFGRDAANQVPLPFDTNTSRRHARLAIENNQPVLYDENSTNGTFVNEQRITRQPLQKGDVVRLGSTRFRVE